MKRHWQKKITYHAVFYLQALNPSAWKGSPLWAAIESLKSGASWHYSRAFLIIEASYFLPSTLGLPVEISKYYNSITVMTVNGEEFKYCPLPNKDIC